MKQPQGFFQFLQKLTGCERLSDIARAVGVDPSDVRAWKNGKWAPGSKTIIKISDNLGLKGKQRRELVEFLILSVDTKTEKRAFGYLRVSPKPHRQDIERDVAAAAIEAYCERVGLKLLGIKQDVVPVGQKVGNRTQLWSLVRAVDRREVDAIVVYESQDVTRDKWESLVVENLFLRRRVDYHSVTEGILTGPQVQKELLALTGLASSIREQAAGKVWQAHGGGQVPYGWKRVKGVLSEHKEEQNILKNIKRMRTNGRTCKFIAEKLNKTGRKPRRTDKWTDKRVAAILRVEMRKEKSKDVDKC